MCLFEKKKIVAVEGQLNQKGKLEATVTIVSRGFATPLYVNDEELVQSFVAVGRLKTRTMRLGDKPRKVLQVCDPDEMTKRLSADRSAGRYGHEIVILPLKTVFLKAVKPNRT